MITIQIKGAFAYTWIAVGDHDPNKYAKQPLVWVAVSSPSLSAVPPAAVRLAGALNPHQSHLPLDTQHLISRHSFPTFAAKLCPATSGAGHSHG